MVLDLQELSVVLRRPLSIKGELLAETSRAIVDNLVQQPAIVEEACMSFELEAIPVTPRSVRIRILRISQPRRSKGQHTSGQAL